MVYYGKADAAAAQRFVAPAVTGFFRSIELGQVQGEWGSNGGCAGGVQPLATTVGWQELAASRQEWEGSGTAPDSAASLTAPLPLLPACRSGPRRRGHLGQQQPAGHPAPAHPLVQVGCWHKSVLLAACLPHPAGAVELLRPPPMDSMIAAPRRAPTTCAATALPQTWRLRWPKALATCPSTPGWWSSHRCAGAWAGEGGYKGARAACLGLAVRINSVTTGMHCARPVRQPAHSTEGWGSLCSFGCMPLLSSEPLFANLKPPLSARSSHASTPPRCRCAA